MGIGEWLATSRIFLKKQTIIVCPNMHLHLYFMCLYLLRYSWGGCWLRDFSWEITLTAPPSSHRNRRALATKLTVFTQISILEINKFFLDVKASLIFYLLNWHLTFWHLDFCVDHLPMIWVPGEREIQQRDLPRVRCWEARGPLHSCFGVWRGRKRNKKELP